MIDEVELQIQEQMQRIEGRSASKKVGCIKSNKRWNNNFLVEESLLKTPMKILQEIQF